MNNKTPSVSVCIFSYNYEKYISSAIESVLMQNTNFPVEIIIGDDFSTDATRQIIKDYKKKYSDIIKLSFNTENRGGTYNWINTINKCRGKYIALLDGDDYFSDKLKLQKQFSALENDKDAVLCFHAVEEKYDNLSGNDKIVRFEKQIYTLEDFLTRGWFIRTGSTFFKAGIMPKNPPKWVYEYPYRYDTILHVFLGQKGHAVYIDEVMSIWRRHEAGMSFALSKKIITNIKTEIHLAKRLNIHTNKEYNSQVYKYCSIQYSNLFLFLFKKGLFLRYFNLFFVCFIKLNLKYTFKRFYGYLKKNLRS